MAVREAQVVDTDASLLRPLPVVIIIVVVVVVVRGCRRRAVVQWRRDVSEAVEGRVSREEE